MDWHAWAAGLFEGEGCFTMRTKPNGKKYPRLSLTSTDEDVVRKFHDAVSIGYVVTRVPQKQHWKPMWTWQAFGFENTQTLATLIGPYLGARRSARLEELLACEPNQYAWRRSTAHCHLPVAPSVAGRQWHKRKGEPICDRCRISHNLYHSQRRSATR